MTLSLRLDPKTKFIVEFVARIKGQSLTTVVERAIKDAAGGVTIGPEYDDRGDPIPSSNWADFWDASEGVRTLGLITDSAYPTTFDEDELKDFTVAHRPFFYTDARGFEPRRSFVDILWPKIEVYLKIWHETKRTDFWAAGEAMKADLAAARVAAPDWPPKSPPPAKPAAKGAEPSSSDPLSGIPF